MFFPNNRRPAHFASGFDAAGRYRRFRNLDQVLLEYDFGSRPAPEDTHVVTSPYDVTESTWTTSMLNHSSEVIGFLESTACREGPLVAHDLLSKPPHFTSVLEKALLQRDVYQILSIYEMAMFVSTLGDRYFSRSLLEEGVRAFGRLVFALRLTPAEYDTLQRSLPTTLDTKQFTAQCRFSLNDNYMPERALNGAQDRDWFESLYDGSASRHDGSPNER